MPGKISHSTLEEIRAANDIVAVIGSYFNLQHRGSTFKALCPFHKEKTPSFIVNQQRQIFHCFGCGAGGDVFRFVMDYEKVDFPTAMRMLAQRAGIRLVFEGDSGSAKSGKGALYELLAKVAAFYHSILKKSDEAGEARNYLRSRGFTAAAVSEFMVGFAPDSWDAVLRWAGNKYSKKRLESAGLVIASPETRQGKDAHYYDRFRNRIMFPVQDEQGRVAGFSARAFSRLNEEGAKYINTPETEVFHKGRILYGLHKARREIAGSREAILCEGQIDVIRCHMAGFKTAIAPQGTAFTEEHAEILRRYADSALLVFDADRAGQDAALRAAHALVEAGMSARIAVLPEGEDPDSLLRKAEGNSLFRKILDNAVSALDFQIDLFSVRERLDTEAGLMRAASAALDMIGKTSNVVQQDVLLKRAAERLGLTEFSLRMEFQKKQAQKRESPRSHAGDSPKQSSAHLRKEAALAEHLVAEPSFSGLVEKYLPLELVTDDLCRETIRAAMEASRSGRDVLEILSERDGAERNLSRFAAGILAAPGKATGSLATNEDCVKSLILGIRTDAIRRRRKEIERARAGLCGKPGVSAEQLKEMEIEYCQLGYDMFKLKEWETAVPVMENT